MTDVDTYISQFDPETQRRLSMIRQTALDTLKNAREGMYHGVPTVWVNDKDTLNYAAYKNHITLYIGYELVPIMKENYPQYQYAKASMKIQNSDALPEDLIQEICSLKQTYKF